MSLPADTDLREALFWLADKLDLYSMARIGSRTTASVGVTFKTWVLTL